VRNSTSDAHRLCLFVAGVTSRHVTHVSFVPSYRAPRTATNQVRSPCQRGSQLSCNVALSLTEFSAISRTATRLCHWTAPSDNNPAMNRRPRCRHTGAAAGRWGNKRIFRLRYQAVLSSPLASNGSSSSSSRCCFTATVRCVRLIFRFARAPV
jgi:hypothetical protein